MRKVDSLSNQTRKKRDRNEAGVSRNLKPKRDAMLNSKTTSQKTSQKRGWKTPCTIPTSRRRRGRSQTKRGNVFWAVVDSRRVFLVVSWHRGPRFWHVLDSGFFLRFRTARLEPPKSKDSRLTRTTISDCSVGWNFTRADTDSDITRGA